MTEKTYITISEAAALFNLTKDQIYYFCYYEDFPYSQINKERQYRINLPKMRKWLETEWGKFIYEKNKVLGDVKSTFVNKLMTRPERQFISKQINDVKTIDDLNKIRDKLNHYKQRVIKKNDGIVISEEYILAELTKIYDVLMERYMGAREGIEEDKARFLADKLLNLKTKIIENRYR